MTVWEVKAQKYEITRVEAPTESEARQLAERIPHTQVVIQREGGYTIAPTDKLGPKKRRGRVAPSVGTYAGLEVFFDTEREAQGATRWVTADGKAFRDFEIVEYSEDPWDAARPSVTDKQRSLLYELAGVFSKIDQEGLNDHGFHKWIIRHAAGLTPKLAYEEIVAEWWAVADGERNPYTAEETLDLLGTEGYAEGDIWAAVASVAESLGGLALSQPDEGWELTADELDAVRGHLESARKKS